MTLQPTTFFWQELLPAVPEALRVAPYDYGYPVCLRDGRVLVLPLRRLPNGTQAVASLIANQASFFVVAALAADMAALARPAAPDVVVGLPTLGIALAPLVAAELGLSRYVPLGYSRKFWYRDDLAEPVSSITSPDGGKLLFIDPNQLPLLAGKRVVVVDDAVSSGRTVVAASRLLQRLGIDVVRIVVAMKQTERWRAPLRALDDTLPDKVFGVFGCPLFEERADGWHPLPPED